MSYQLYLEPEVHEARKQLPGAIRQRIRRVIDELQQNSRPANGRELTLAEPLEYISIWRVRVDQWRIVYAIHEHEQWVRVFGIRRRPPYAYQDIEGIIAQLRD